jgi:processive 1,2-diacylglycerol beta-glucosyltransferase
MSKKRKVLFTYVEAGMGHIIPIKSISEAFKAKYGSECEVVDSFIFSQSKSEKVQKMGKELAEHTIRASVNWLYNKFEAFSYLLSSKLTLKFLDWHFRKARNDFYSDLKEINPDLIVSSYYLPSHLAEQANEKGFTNTLIATYSPDPYIYPSWDRKCDMFLVNNDNAYDMAICGGFDKNKVVRVPAIYKKEILDYKSSKEQARLSLGVEIDKFNVLYTGGAYGTKGTEKLVKTLLCAGLNIHLTVVCGKNESIYNNMIALDKFRTGNTSYQVVGYTCKLHEYITASDLVIGKAGSNTMMEVAHLNRPLIVYRESSRLEEKTAQFFEKEKTAKRIRNPKKIVEYIKSIQNNPEMLKIYSDSFAKYKDESGADYVADLLYGLLNSKQR